MLEKITIEPVPEGFTKVSGVSVGDTLKILEEKGINRYLVFPRDPKFDTEREHIIILPYLDYCKLSVGRCFGEIEWRGVGSTYVGLYCDAEYSNGKTKVHESTQLRMFHPFFSPKDWDFLEANGISTFEAMRLRDS
ncbi:MAG: hypothetical protein Q7S27_05485 [Nanoarchaeota archaeon]|nr:hypothetical protein [Nanoarchaeota archaeon]